MVVPSVNLAWAGSGGDCAAHCLVFFYSIVNNYNTINGFLFSIRNKLRRLISNANTIGV